MFGDEKKARNKKVNNLQIPSTAYYALSLAASFVISFLLLAKPRSLLFLIALAAVLFILFGPLALPAFFIALGLQGLLREYKKEKKLFFY